MKDFKAKLRKFLPKIKDAKEKCLNEADTRIRVRVLLSEVLGYDLLEDITKEEKWLRHCRINAPFAAGRKKPAKPHSLPNSGSVLL